VTEASPYKMDYPECEEAQWSPDGASPWAGWLGDWRFADRYFHWRRRDLGKAHLT